MYRKPPSEDGRQDVYEINIGSKENPNIIEIGKDTSHEERENIENTMKEYKAIFSQPYDYSMAQKYDIFQHKIPIKEGEKQLRRKLRNINPNIGTLTHKELQNMLIARIIVPTTQSPWMLNMAIMIKRNNKISFCMDLRNINQNSLKDNFFLYISLSRPLKRIKIPLKVSYYHIEFLLRGPTSSTSTINLRISMKR